MIAWLDIPLPLFLGVLGPALVVLCVCVLGLRYIPHDKVGIVEKLWSTRGGLQHGQIVALDGEAGFQADVLRGGLHWFLFFWQYRLHTVPLVVIAESKIGYVYATDGTPLPPTQTLAHSVECNNFQDTRAFLTRGGQRGRQRAILREGVYAINLAQFVVITEARVYSGRLQEKDLGRYQAWQAQLASIRGFDPVIVGRPVYANAPGSNDSGGLDLFDTIGIVTVHDGAPIESGEIIAPEVRPASGQKDHDYFQAPEAFLALGGRRGKQLQVLTDGTFYINRWFATVELSSKTLIPIGYVGVVVSYYGTHGEDVTGQLFRYGEQVEPGRRGVWKQALPPGKYALNPYAMTVEHVPTVNFVLHWVTGVTEAHQYDRDLRSIDIITADGYEPQLPLSLVLHIDYEKAPRVVQRFGDVKRLISQTLDPILSAYFRDVAQSTQMLDLLTRREEIQKLATEELGRRFREYDINCVAVLIGRPQTSQAHGGAEDPIDKLFDQLRARRLAEEQIATYAKQRSAALQLKELNSAKAEAEKQFEVTQTAIDVDIAANRGEAELAQTRRLAECEVVRADGDGRAKDLLGRGEASRITQTGGAEAQVFLQKIRAYGDPRLFALSLVSERIASSSQPLVPERLFVNGGSQGTDSTTGAVGAGLFGQLLALLLADKAGFSLGDEPSSAPDTTTSDTAPPRR